MENYDANAEQQVWQRVFAQPGQPPREDLRGLVLSAAELAGVYRKLSGSLTGRAKELARGLYQGETANVACLKGLSFLSGGSEEGLRSWNPDKAPVRRQLEKCYHRTRRCMTEYAARSAEAEFGEVFRRLADREGQHCAWLAELLGSL